MHAINVPGREGAVVDVFDRDLRGFGGRGGCGEKREEAGKETERKSGEVFHFRKSKKQSAHTNFGASLRCVVCF